MTLFRVHTIGFDGGEGAVLVDAIDEADAKRKREIAMTVDYDQGMTQFAIDSHKYEAFMAKWDEHDPSSVEGHEYYISGEWDLPRKPHKPMEPHKVTRVELANLEPDPELIAMLPPMHEPNADGVVLG